MMNPLQIINNNQDCHKNVIFIWHSRPIPCPPQMAQTLPTVLLGSSSLVRGKEREGTVCIQ